MKIAFAFLFGSLALPLAADSMLVPDRASGKVLKVLKSGSTSDWQVMLSSPESLAIADNGRIAGRV